MNTATATTNTHRRLEVLPVLAALAFHAVAFERWLLALPLVTGLAAVIIFDLSVSATRQRLYAAGGIGLLAGLAMLAVSRPPSGPLPPALLSSLTGMLIGFATFGVLARQVATAWISGWVLVALSGQVPMSTGLGVSLVAFMAASLIGAASLAGLLRAGPRVLPALVMFAILVASATAGIAAGAKRLDGTFQNALQSLFTERLRTSIAGVGRDITLDARSTIELSRRGLLDLSSQPGLLRVRVLDRFDGRRWSTSPELRGARLSLADIPNGSESARELDMTFLDDLGDTLPSPAGTSEVRGGTSWSEGGWVLRGEDLAATVTLVGGKEERLPREPQSGPELLTVPDVLRDGLGPVAERVAGSGTTTREKSELVERFFRDNFEYALETDLSGPEHPLIVLVRERRPAYCVYFASAMAVMLRTQGIPARVVSGFAPTECNPMTGRVTVRQRDAHAWVEAWLAEEQRFVAFDPTPARSRERVLGVAQTPGLLPAFAGAVRSAVQRAWLTCWQNPARLLATVFKSPITWVLLGVLLLLYLRQKWSSRNATAIASSQESSDVTLRRIYRRYLKSLRRAGIAPRPWETDDELIARLADHDSPRLAELAQAFIAHYRLARFRGEPVEDRLMDLASLRQ